MGDFRVYRVLFLGSPTCVPLPPYLFLKIQKLDQPWERITRECISESTELPQAIPTQQSKASSTSLTFVSYFHQQAHFSTLLAGQSADDPDRLVDAGGVAEAQVRVVFALEHFIVLDQGFTEQFECPGVALDGG